MTTPFKSIVLLTVLALAVTAPIFLFGVPHGNDLPQHYQFAAAYLESLGSGNLLPSWSVGANEGLGDLGIRVYPPAGYYYLAGLRLMAGNWHLASVVTFFFLFLASGIGAYAFAREWLSEGGALLSGVVYILAPYHVNELFNAFTYAEFAAAAVLPFCFFFVIRICEGQTIRPIIGLGASYALLVLSHLPILVIGSLALLLFAFICMRAGSRLRAFGGLGAGVLLGLAASSFYWMRLLGEIGNVAHSAESYTSGAFDFHTNFVGSLFISLGSEAEARGIGFIDSMFLATLLFFIPGLILSFVSCRKTFDRRFLASGSIFILAFFLMTPLSLPLWKNIRLLQLTQFPWRSMILISLAASLFAGFGFDAVAATMQTKWRPAAVAVAGLLLAGVTFTGAQVIRPASYHPIDQFENSVGQFATARSCECWWPVWGKQGALAHAGEISVPGRLVTSTTVANDRLSVHLTNGPDTQMRIGRFYHPNWIANVDGEPAAVTPDENGTIVIHIPHGSSSLELLFREPYYVKQAFAVSVVTWLFFAIILAVFTVRRSKPGPEQI